MTFVITRSCCNDASCIPVCPVDCIHPTPDEPEFGTTEMLYIDPVSCIDCGACVDHCPVSAIAPDYDLRDDQTDFLALNAAWFEEPGRRGREVPASTPTRSTALEVRSREPLRVAVVGSGPAALFVAEEILGRRGLGASVRVFERLDSVGGLVRFGVAPDHQDTRDILDTFTRTMRRDGFAISLNTAVGRDVTVAELQSRFHAVVLATGAALDRRLGIPGEDLPGSHSAREFVSWYNGHPEHTEQSFDLAVERAVIIGNGNVALDVARLLASDVERLAGTSISQQALDGLRASTVGEVLVAGRRGVTEAAFSAKELLQLGRTPGFRLSARPEELLTSGHPDALSTFKLGLLQDAAGNSTRTDRDRSVVLRFNLAPVEILGEGRVQSVRFERTTSAVAPDGSVSAVGTGVLEEVPCGLVFRSVGYRGRPVPGVPFDPTSGTVPHREGRVVDPATGLVLAGLFTSGWIKRGPSGVIGSNKQDARQTVAAILEDYGNGRLPGITEG